MKMKFKNIDPCKFQDFLIKNNIVPISTTSDIKSDENGMEINSIANNATMEFDDSINENDINVLLNEYNNAEQ